METKTQPPRPEVQLVVFDLGRVLLRIADDWDHAARLAELHHLAGMTGDLSTRAARGNHHPLSELFDRFETGRVDVVSFLAEAARLTGHGATDIRRVLEAVLIETFPGAAALLDRLALTPVKTACLSNTNAHHWQLFNDREHAAFLPLDAFDFPLFSQIIGHAKPAPAVYQFLEDGTGIAPRHILFFDDIAENIEAARRRGWHAELVERCENPVPWITQRLVAYGVLEA